MYYVYKRTTGKVTSWHFDKAEALRIAALLGPKYDADCLNG